MMDDDTVSTFFFFFRSSSLQNTLMHYLRNLFSHPVQIGPLTLFWTGSGITLLDGGGPLWPGWILAILRLSVGILKPKNDFHQTILIFGCP